ncbi:hypothetical protein [Flavonifractor sp. An10]|uniref:hypothetical protein n=1 Tax=Flavonifractor sp. An10 TaxID=1965537 RepID=UPI001140EFA4|nr:hypothetical protein [Flavonifractor sp. An10]
MKRVWTARSLAAVLGGSLLYFLITVLVMMCGSFSPLFWVFLPAITASGGPNAPVWGTGTHELSGASAVPGGG